MRRLLLLIISICLAASASFARPLLDSSEESYASVCIGYDDTPDRLIEICQLALDAPGATRAQRADMRDSLGNALYEQSRLDEAEAIFDQILTENPSSARALKGLGWVAQERGNHEAARDYFQSSVDIVATDTALAGLGHTLWELRAVPVDEALAYLDGALALTPDYPWAARQKGWILLQANRAEDALDVFTEIAEERPYDQYAQAGLIRVNITLGRYDLALGHANRGVDLSENGYWYISQRSHVLYMLGRYKQAIRDANRLVKIDPNDSEGYVRKARAMAAIGARADGLALLDKAEAKTGATSFLIYWRASILIDDEQYDAAYTQIIRNTGSGNADEDDFELLALVQYRRDEFQAARRAIDRALSLNAQMPYTIYYDAILMLEEGKGPRAAVARFDDAIKTGLPDHNIGDFASQLIDAGYLLQAIAIRAKYTK